MIHRRMPCRIQRTTRQGMLVPMIPCSVRRSTDLTTSAWTSPLPRSLIPSTGGLAHCCPPAGVQLLGGMLVPFLAADTTSVKPGLPVEPSLDLMGGSDPVQDRPRGLLRSCIAPAGNRPRVRRDIRWTPGLLVPNSEDEAGVLEPFARLYDWLCGGRKNRSARCTPTSTRPICSRPSQSS